MIDSSHKWNTAIGPLIWGFVLTLALTFLAYFLVVSEKVAGYALDFSTVGLGALMAIIQFIFYLHLCLEQKPRWSLMIFGFFVLVTIIIIGGSLWIMANLNYNVMEKPLY